MLLYAVAACCVALTAGHVAPQLQIQDKDSQDKVFRGPENIMEQYTMIYLNAGIMEDVVSWRTNTSSRIDYNNGAVKSITLKTFDGIKTCEIHPESDENETSTIKCYCINHKESNLTVAKDNMLSETVQAMAFVGFDIVKGRNTSKFESITKEGDFQIQESYWAVYEKQDDDSLAWTPIRHEQKQFNNRFGSLGQHSVKEYSGYFAGSKYVKNEVFDIKNCKTLFCDSTKNVIHPQDEYVRILKKLATELLAGYKFYKQRSLFYSQVGCKDVINASNSEYITKNLMFINPEEPEHVDYVFKSFKSKFQRQYNEDKEHAVRRKLFQNSMRLVSSVNKKNLGYKLSINQFADRTPQEMEQHTGLLRRPRRKSSNIAFPHKEATFKPDFENLPKTYDMRLLGLISPVKNQQDCGACWAFAATATAEGALARANGGELMSLSEQAIIDCTWSFSAAKGCKGGNVVAAYEFMKKYGLPTEEEYGSYKNHVTTDIIVF